MGFAVIGFVLIRIYQNELFHDPLIQFYKSNFQNAIFPELEFWRYNLSLIFRYILNTTISLAVIWILFQKRNYVQFSAFLYVVIFIICVVAFWIIEHNITSDNFMKLFYIRRFLIQPILIILLIPAFYFQNISKKG